MIKRYANFALMVLLSFCATYAINAKDSPELRALAIGLENGLKNLEILDANLQPVGQLSLRQFAFSKEFTCPVVEGQLIFGIPDGVDANGNPKYKRVASVDWKNSYNQACLLFLPKSLKSDENQGIEEYTIQLLDMNTKTFGLGHSKIINLTSLNTFVQVGEHEATVAAWEKAEFSKVEELTGVNMAQINVSYYQDDTEHVAYQSRVRYSENMRNIILIYTDNRSQRTTARIIKDTGRLF